MGKITRNWYDADVRLLLKIIGILLLAAVFAFAEINSFRYG